MQIYELTLVTKMANSTSETSINKSDTLSWVNSLNKWQLIKTFCSCSLGVRIANQNSISNGC